MNSGKNSIHCQNERHLSHSEVQCPSQERQMNHRSVQCELIGAMVDTRSIGSGPEPQIHSARTGELLCTSQQARSQVNELFDNKENQKPKLKSKKFQPPRDLTKKNDSDDFEDDWFEDYCYKKNKSS